MVDMNDLLQKIKYIYIYMYIYTFYIIHKTSDSSKELDTCVHVND